MLESLRLLLARIREPAQKPPTEGDPPAEEHIPEDAHEELELDE